MPERALPSFAQLEPYTEELAAIKRFLIKPKDTLQFQDWLRVTKPELRAFTKRLSAHAYPIDDPVFGGAVRYTKLLNLLCAIGKVATAPTASGARLYTWAG